MSTSIFTTLPSPSPLEAATFPCPLRQQKATFDVIDIRPPTELRHQQAPFDIIDIRPPTEKARGDDLASTILESLDKEEGAKSIPTLVLYDSRGLQLFDQITELEEYYLTSCEVNILQNDINEIIGYVKNGSAIIELGSGSLRKTSLLLKALEQQRRDVTYYALDLDSQELVKSLSSLGKDYKNIRLVGLLGTYDQGMEWLSTRFPADVPKVILWLGSSVGNLKRDDAASFIRTFQENTMNPQDLFLIGIDRRNDARKISIAYDDPRGVTREFIMNGLDHVNAILGHFLLDRAAFEYAAHYNDIEGRHEAHYRSLRDQTLSYAGRTIHIRRSELVHIEYSYKYSAHEVDDLVNSSRLHSVHRWTDSRDLYDLHLLQKAPFTFPLAPPATSYPSASEWRDLWFAWDTVTMTMITPRMLFERPIDLRHPFIFYLGHIPAFLDIQLSRVLGETYTEPARFADIFERGIDPDIDDPTKCHAHSEVPDREDDWPRLDEILDFRVRVRERMLRVLREAERAEGGVNKRIGRIMWMTFEHEAMHLETILYMLIQSPNVRPPKGFMVPLWAKAQGRGRKAVSRYSGGNEKCHLPISTAQLAPEPVLLSFPAGTILLGHNDSESSDATDFVTSSYGWDNESPARTVPVPAFAIQSRPVTNAEYHAFLLATSAPASLYPRSWIQDSFNDNWLVRTIYGPALMTASAAANWPVAVSQEQATAYAEWKRMRLPTESEWMRMRRAMLDGYDHPDSPTTSGDVIKNIPAVKYPNIGMRAWHPTPVGTAQAVSDLWEWTASLWDTYDGFEPSKIYPGYSVDFFDGKHNVVLGGSWATHPRVGLRASFRNWYQRGYPYVFAGFRLCA